MSFFAELQRRNVFKVAAAYLILAWVVIQVADTAVPALHLPEWVLTLVFFLGALGFPFVLFFAWVFEITPEGVRRESDIKPEESITAHTGQKLNHMIIALLVVALAYFIYESRFQTPSDTTIETTENVGSASIAVLPFVNMSSDPEQEYFSDGISEEILNVLSKIPNLHITSRSSAFSFKGKEIKLSEVAKELGVENILEGSVRKSGTKIRITAQLIEAASDKHLWSETYDRDLSDIFAVQDEISAAIVGALKDQLGLEVAQASSKSTSINPEAFDLYLHGQEGIHEFSFASLEEAEIALNSALVLEPDFQAARVSLAFALALQVITGSSSDLALLDEAEALLATVLAAEPDNGNAFYVLSNIADIQGEDATALDHIKTAYQLNPNDAAIITDYANLAGRELGEAETRGLFARAERLDPLNGYIYYYKGRYLERELQAYDEVLDAYQKAKTLSPTNTSFTGWLAGANGYFFGNMVATARGYKEFIELDPSDPDGPIYASKAYLTLGDAETALEYAIQALDLMPTSGQAIESKTAALMALERNEEALVLFQETLANDAVFYRRQSLSQFTLLGVRLLLDKEGYIQAEELILSNYPKLKDLDSLALRETIDDTVMISTALAAVYRASGDEAKAKRITEHNKQFSEATFLKHQKRLTAFDSINLAMLITGRLDDDEVIALLEATIDGGFALEWRNLIDLNPVFSPLQSHPRYISLKTRIEADMATQLAQLRSEESSATD